MKEGGKYTLLLLAVGAALAAWALRRLLLVLLLAAALAYVLHHPLQWLRQKCGKWGMALVLCGVSAAWVGAVVLLTPHLARQVEELASALPGMLQRVEEVVARLEALLHLQLPPVDTLFSALLGRLGDWMLRLGGEGSLAYLAVLPLACFYFLRDRLAFFGALQYLIPVAWREEACALLGQIDRRLRSYLRGQAVVALAVGGLTVAGLLLTGMPYSLVLGLFMALCNLIPYVGPWLGAAPILAVGLFSGLRQALAALGVVLAVQLVENNLVSPRIIGDSIALHPLAVMVSILAGGTLFGAAGMLLAIPLLVVGRECAAFWLQTKMRRIPQDTPQ